jgi:hypothetical protein
MIYKFSDLFPKYSDVYHPGNYIIDKRVTKIIENSSSKTFEITDRGDQCMEIMCEDIFNKHPEVIGKLIFKISKVDGSIRIIDK